ncbi:hypothetical protein CYMTET_52120 [Cymbomonas tetramitiformis]|uniref:Integrase catalytic domain-containing protein n=1 Tax=Cymbomonas tetramitiformis TaxID=36881 RepID=A0AAE0BLA9_9CHLO|nr:hypothetical protein CYMTET_52120 [Cymbomonas tetramitiformis]
MNFALGNKPLWRQKSEGNSAGYVVADAAQALQRCMSWRDAEDTAAVAKSLLGDRRRQAEEKKVNDSKHLVCAVCSGGHSSESCWLVHPQKMEEFIKKNPAKEAMCRERYEKRKKRHLAQKTEDRVAAAVSTAEKMTDDEIWEARSTLSAVWWGLTKKLEELQTNSKGSVIFSASKDQCYRVEELTESEPGRVWIQGTPWPVTLFYLDQFTVGRIDAKLLAHLRLGHLCDRAILGEDLDVEEIVYDLDLLVLQSDNDSMIISGQTAEYCKQHNIIQRTTAPYLHENNARVESYNRLLQAKARAMLMTAGLPASMWPLAFRHAVYLLNCVVKAELGMKSSLDVLNQKVDLSTLRIFDCRAYAFIDASLRAKLADRATPLLYLDAPYFERFTGSPTPILDIAAYAPSDSDEFTGVVKLQSRSANKCTTFWAPLTSGAEWEDAIVCANAREEHRLPYQVLLLRHCGRTGKSVDIAGTSIRFQASDKKEECALIDVKGAIVPVPNLPAGVKALGMKAIYKPKVDAANVLTERKSRWVVFGNKQSHGVNYEEVYSPCTQLNTLRILLQLSLILGLLAFTMDVVTCFLNGELDVANPLYVSEAWKNTFFASFNSAYPSVDEGALTDILGMRMTFRDAGLVRECRMSQHGLIHRMLEKYGMTDCNPALSPMEPKLALTPADPQDVATAFPYANLAMELMWLGRCTRPDILPACSSPASHNAELVVAAYSDADHAADKVTRRSVTGSLVRLNGSTVMCSSKLQKTVAVSTADAELVALSETARDIEHVVNLLSEFAPVKLPVVLHGDNHASIIQAESALNNTASRHIAVRDRYVAKLAELGRIRIVKVPSVENLAGFFIKFMPTDRERVRPTVLNSENQSVDDIKANDLLDLSMNPP